MAKNITFRTQLLGGVCEFCHNTNLPLLSDTLNLVDLIVLLARYQEEGVILCPKVYITNGIDKIGQMLPEGEKIKIGSAIANKDGVKQAIKKCAPLADGGWSLYIQDNNDNIEYGLFRGDSSPIAVMMDDVLLDSKLNFVVVKVYKIAGDCVEIRCNNGYYHFIFLNQRKEESPPPLQFLDNLVAAIAEKAIVEVKDPTISFLKKLLFESLRQSHGCIIAITNKKRTPRILSKDGVILENPINFPLLIKMSIKDQRYIAQIESKGHLLKGMLNSDGIIVFNDSGMILGYNCFVKSKQGKNVDGGARKRAFATLSAEIGKNLTAVFMQSQDGWTDFKGINHV